MCLSCCLFTQRLMDTAKSLHAQGNFLAEEIQIRVSHAINRSGPKLLLLSLCELQNNNWRQTGKITSDIIRNMSRSGDPQPR